MGLTQEQPNTNWLSMGSQFVFGLLHAQARPRRDIDPLVAGHIVVGGGQLWDLGSAAGS